MYLTTVVVRVPFHVPLVRNLVTVVTGKMRNMGGHLLFQKSDAIFNRNTVIQNHNCEHRIIFQVKRNTIILKHLHRPIRYVNNKINIIIVLIIHNDNNTRTVLTILVGK